MNKYLLIAVTIIASSVQADEGIKRCQNEGKSFYECKQEFEARFIKGIDDLIIRDGKTLTLKPLEKHNPDKVLVDGDLQYTVKAHFPEPQISLISVTGWEYFNAYAYHHKYGTYIEVFDEIRFSEDGKYLLAFGDDIEAGFTPNAVAVYKLGHWPELLVHFQNMNFGVSDANFSSSGEA
ncbi:hypothetical protein SOPP22_11115 [Shewanella sp. OPT22]|nr:hypothetical protein SOPP22_11115 [Shewanella sp. OPT22]